MTKVFKKSDQPRSKTIPKFLQSLSQIKIIRSPRSTISDKKTQFNLFGLQPCGI